MTRVRKDKCQGVFHDVDWTKVRDSIMAFEGVKGAGMGMLTTLHFEFQKRRRKDGVERANTATGQDNH